jgi:peptidoglycan hydrolase-like amidase
MEVQKEAGGTWTGCTSLPMIKYYLAMWGMGSPAPDFPLPPTTINGVKRPAKDICLDKDFAASVAAILDPQLDSKGIEILQMSSESPRIWAVSVDLKDGKKIDLDDDGRAKLKSLSWGRYSNLFTIGSTQADGLIPLVGHGYGHGVGMCQWGAQIRAQKYKQNYKQILNFYYDRIAFEDLTSYAP